jgi:hypothetical protein
MKRHFNILVGLALVIALGTMVALLLVGGLLLRQAAKPTVMSPAVNPTTNSTPVCKSSSGCTASEVASHNTVTDCWVSYQAKVYNVTDYTTQHPGGMAVFSDKTCGHDITSYLSGQAAAGGRAHNHSDYAYSQLGQYYVANLLP